MKLKSEITQGNIARWSEAIRALRPQDVRQEDLPTAEYYSINIKAAVMAGWFENGATPEMVDEMTPRAAQKLSRQVWDIYANAYSKDPN